MDTLFRPEAIRAQREMPWSDALLAVPVRYALYTTLAAAFVIVALIYTFVGEYSRKQTAPGYLVPTHGVVKVIAPRAGTITAVHVEAGDTVVEGQSLLSMETPRGLESGRDVNARILSEMQQQQRQIATDIDRVEQLQTLKERQLRDQIAVLEREIVLLTEQIHTQQARTRLAQVKWHRYGKLLAKGLISELGYGEQQDAYLAAVAAKREYEQRLVNRRQTLAQRQAELRQLPMQTEERLSTYQAQLSVIRQREAEVLGQQSVTLRASVSGTVAFLNAQAGGSAQSGVTLLSILPGGSKLEIQLFIPTHAIGFVAPGQDVYLRYDAFPYQRYGMHKGRIVSVSGTILHPREMALPLDLHGPVYQVRATLEQQELHTPGKRLALQSGMTLVASIRYDTRSLLNWLLDPISSLRDKPHA